MGTTHLGVPWWVVPPRGTPRCSSGPLGPFPSRKNRQKVSLHLDFISYGFSGKPKISKETTNGTRHWVNRLVPKNDIKLL